MARIRGAGKWSGRPSLNEIENQAVRLVAEFQRRLTAAGLAVPDIPPVPVEYLALTLTDFSVRGVEGLECDGQKLSGFLDTTNEEICYEESEAQVRQNFTIAHELGHYFLHYLPDLQAASQPTLFALEEVAAPRLTRFFRCSEQEIGEISEEVDDEAEEDSSDVKLKKAARLSKAALDDVENQVKLAKVIRLKERANRFEWEANIFATSLLMPRDLVRWLYRKHGGDVKKVARELGVSNSALANRLKSLKLGSLETLQNRGANSPRKSNKNTPNQGTFF